MMIGIISSIKSVKYSLSFWCYQDFVEWLANNHNDDSMLFKLLCKKIWNMESFKSTHSLGNKVDMRHVWFYP